MRKLASGFLLVFLSLSLALTAYTLTGMLGGTLDEAEMEKIACSIGAE